MGGGRFVGKFDVMRLNTSGYERKTINPTAPVHYCCSSLLFTTAVHHCCSPLLFATTVHTFPLLTLFRSRFLLDNGAQVDHPYKDGVTPLSVASQNGHLPVCEILVNAGADVNAANAEGLTPVMIASIRGHVAVIQFLVDSSDRNILNGADDEGRLPMHQVCTFEDADPDPNVIKVLVRNHPRALIMTDGDGHTPEEAALLTSVSIHMNITGKRKDPDSPSIAANIPLLSSLTAAYTVGDFPTLISLCGGTSLRLERLHSLSLRATTVLCLERIMTTKAPLTLTLRLILTDEMTKKAIWLLASVYNREKGIVREIVSYLGSASD